MPYNNLYKILFYLCLSSVLFLSVVPHPNSEVVSSTSDIKEQFDLLGELAYVGEKSIGEFSDKYRHLIAFWSLAFLFDFAYKVSIFLKITILSFYGGMIEFVQYLLPYRDFDMYDLLFNILFLFLYYFSLGIFIKSFISKRIADT